LLVGLFCWLLKVLSSLLWDAVASALVSDHRFLVFVGTIPHLPSIDIVQDAKGESLNKPVTLRFPLSAKRCKQLMALGAKTPFGKGPEKLQDDQVRLGWQLEPQ